MIKRHFPSECLDLQLSFLRQAYEEGKVEVRSMFLVAGWKNLKFEFSDVLYTAEFQTSAFQGTS